MKPILEVRNLSYCYHNSEVKALDNISVDIHESEKIAIVGNNGSGKSTFFLNCNGVLEAQKGEIYFDGNLITRKKQDLINLRKNVGIVFQDADNQIITSSVLSEISFGAMNLKLSKEEVKQRTFDTIKLLNLEDYTDKVTHYLSGGEKKRVSIADVLVMKPRIIIFDEPTSSLDPENSQLLENILNTLCSNNTTIILSTHDIDFAYRWAERVIVFNKGKIIADGETYEVLSNDKILNKAGLKKPTFIQIMNVLNKYNTFERETPQLRNIDDFERFIKSIKQL